MDPHNPDNLGSDSAIRRWLILLTACHLIPLFFLFAHKELAHVRNWQILMTLGIVAYVVRYRCWFRLWEGSVSKNLWRFFFAATLIGFNASVFSRYFAFEINAYDFSIFDLMLEHTLTGAFMYNPVCDCDHFSIHFTPIVFLLLPVHAVVKSPLFLLIVHATALWASLFPLKRIAQRHLESPRLVYMVCLCFSGFYITASTLGYPFHPEVFYPLLLLWFIDGWEKRSLWLVVISLILGLSVKEDASIYFAAIAVVLGVFPRSGQKRIFPLAVFALCCLVFVLVNGWIHPMFRSVAAPNTSLHLWSEYGASMSEAFLGMLIRPWSVLGDLFNSHWVILYAAALFVPLLDWRGALAALPCAVLLATSNEGSMRSFGLYYAAPFLAPFFWSWVVGLKKMRWRKVAILGLLVAPLVGKSYIKYFPPKLGVLADIGAALPTLQKAEVICVQSAFMPHMPYGLPLAKLDEACLDRGDAMALAHPGLNAYPLTPEKLEAILSRHKRFLLELKYGTVIITDVEKL